MGAMTQMMPIPECKWKRFAIDFMVGLPQTLGMFNAIWVIVDRLTKSATFYRFRLLIIKRVVKI